MIRHAQDIKTPLSSNTRHLFLTREVLDDEREALIKKHNGLFRLLIEKMPGELIALSTIE